MKSGNAGSMHHELKQKAINLRTQKLLSYSAILGEVPVAKSTLSVWLKPYPLSKDRILELRRAAWSKSEAKIELFRSTMREKRAVEDEGLYQKYLRRLSNLHQDSFFVSGLMLYLAEGTKKAPAKLALANTDARVHRFFIRWLEKFFSVHRDQLRIHLQLYETMDIEKELDFWYNELLLPKAQFYKPFIRKCTLASFSYKESFRHGTASTIVFGSRLQREVKMAIRALLDAQF